MTACSKAFLETSLLQIEQTQILFRYRFWFAYISFQQMMKNPKECLYSGMAMSVFIYCFLKVCNQSWSSRKYPHAHHNTLCYPSLTVMKYSLSVVPQCLLSLFQVQFHDLHKTHVRNFDCWFLLFVSVYLSFSQSIFNIF